MSSSATPDLPSVPAADGAALLRRVRIVLVAPSHPGNIGAAARALKTMGLAQLHLFMDPNCTKEQARDYV